MGVCDVGGGSSRELGDSEKAEGVGCGMGGSLGSDREAEKVKGLPPFLQESVYPAHLSAQLGRTLPSQRGPWKPLAQRQEEEPGLFTHVPPLRHGAGERRL